MRPLLKEKITSLNPFLFCRDNLAGTGTQGQVHQVGFVPNSFLVHTTI
jgi:iron complex outermembrane receptor protein